MTSAAALAEAAPPAPASPQFTDLHTPEAIANGNPHVFSSLGSLLWFMRLHHAELLEAGAVVELAGRKLIRGQVFIECALAIGARRHADRFKR